MAVPDISEGRPAYQGAASRGFYILSSSKRREKGKSVDTKFEKSLVIRQPNAFKNQRPSLLGKPTTFSNSFVRKDFSKSTSVTQTHVSNDFSKPVTTQILPANKKSILKNTNVLNPGIYKIYTDHTQNRTSKLPPDSRNTNKRVTFSTGVIPSTSVSRPQLKSNPMEDRVLRNNSHGKKQKVEDHRRNVKLPKNKTSVTACNDSLNAKTVNVKSASIPQLKSNPQGDRVMHNNSRGQKLEVEEHRRNVKLPKNKMSVTACNDSLNAKTLNIKSVSMCDKCVLIDKHDMCVLKSVAKPLKETVALESNKKPRNNVRKLYERLRKIYKWSYIKFTPSGYMWKTKLPIGNVNSNVSLPLDNISQTANVLKTKTSRCSKHMTGNLKLLINFMKKFLGTVKFGNDQIAPILGYGDLGNDLLTGSRGTDLYSITIQDTTCPNLICLMAKATSSQAWLWHHRLSHLNFDTINLLSKNDIVVGLPKLKFVKDHLCSSCELGKAKRKSFHSKLTPSSK
nr:hypothetical protein [Tanacetum cinerariifolium]